MTKSEMKEINEKCIECDADKNLLIFDEGTICCKCFLSGDWMVEDQQQKETTQ